MDLKKKQVDKRLFNVNTVDLWDATVLIRIEYVDTTKGKNVVIGEPRHVVLNRKRSSREAILQKSPNGRESIKVTEGPGKAT